MRGAPWPQGCQLGALVLSPSEGVRGSAKDLRAFYFQLHWDAAQHNCVGRRLRGDDFRDLILDAPEQGRLGLLVPGMGNANAADFAHMRHAGVLRSVGNLDPSRTLLYYGSPLPRSKLLEGLIIDDYVAVLIAKKPELARASGPDLHGMHEACF